MPSYVKFLKDILSKKRRLNEYKIVALMQEIGKIALGCALCDLGASINLGIGQSFLFIRNALIDAHQRKLALRVNKQEVKFNIFNLLKYPNEPEHYNTIKSFGQDYCKEEVIVELFCNNV
ncbi:uncharacterized protein E5676_scaffold216G00670 [Cucumis melo var. makuwa]|uniref:Uncharacterized protein n=1 Tax=Cucumis melo var. makuwa TaxID=1194695 RepID=A0A5A7UV26_CUCMM|nr:uncharacterized protein E6C27_scaffold280G002650 [Cucumis melo var. makuwa]TYK30092.1 uncharacterized protein E5676_scaffold216G00670 [Cucumis melo var. makuwa]